MIGEFIRFNPISQGKDFYFSKCVPCLECFLTFQPYFKFSDISDIYNFWTRLGLYEYSISINNIVYLSSLLSTVLFY
jgi:hypothetical protein